jgi:FKBP-type peptidyl-prolyl cis-trans isomerase FkpA
MNKIKYFILIACIAACFTACKKGNDSENFDVEAQYQKDTTAIRSFLVANKIVALKEPKSGVFYQILNPGTGNFVYTSSTYVTANYTGRLLDGTQFDSSKGTAKEFALSRVIAGWQIGVPFVQKGGSIRLFIPSYYGYGNVNQGNSIPANSVLDFTIDVTDLKN